MRLRARPTPQRPCHGCLKLYPIAFGTDVPPLGSVVNVLDVHRLETYDDTTPHWICSECYQDLEDEAT